MSQSIQIGDVEVEEAPKKRTSFLENLTVERRIYLMVLAPLLLVLLVSFGAIFALNQSQHSLNDIRVKIDAIDAGNKMIRRTQRDFRILMRRVAEGGMTWDKGLKKLEKAETAIRTKTIPRYKEYKAKELAAGDEQLTKALAQMDSLLEAMRKGQDLLRDRDIGKLESYIRNGLYNDSKPLRDAVHKQVQLDIKDADAAFVAATNSSRSFLKTWTVIVLVGMVLVALLSYLIYRSISNQINRLLSTIRDISAGDLNARTDMQGNSELTELGETFDSMVEERIATQKRIDADHRQLNDSVFGLLDAVADLSERNLTVRATVTEDATGPLADAINQLAEDTSDVLLQVREVALSVEQSSEDVNRHALSVSELSAVERDEAEETAEQMGRILRRLDTIADSAQSANTVAGATTQATQEAQESVAQTLGSMSGIRDTVQETGKRLKRLGERSQEISRIIDIINTISERTAVLALNASMQATAAGEAGRGFSMIAEEIQRLAESSHESTDQIAVLVRNIQQEANTTIATMDETIAEVVDGSTLAEQAAARMDETLKRTNELVDSVEKIASASAEQVDISKDLQTRAEKILDATQSTGKELLSLTKLTSGMAESGKKLVKSVNVFKLEG